MSIKEEILLHKKKLLQIKKAKSIEELPEMYVEDIKNAIVLKLGVDDNELLTEKLMKLFDIDEELFISTLVYTPFSLEEGIIDILMRKDRDFIKAFNQARNTLYDIEIQNMAIEYMHSHERKKEFDSVKLS